MESGRYGYFDASSGRFICADCDGKDNLVGKRRVLEEMYAMAKEYLAKTYPDINFADNNVEFDDVYPLDASQCLSENYYRVDYGSKTVFVERDNPRVNVRVSIMRALIAFWQVSHSLSNHYSNAQLYFEELKYLRYSHNGVSADWIYENLPEELRRQVDEIAAAVNAPDAPTDTPEGEES